MSITLRSMRYFVTALRLGSISGAAEILHVAPSAVASAIDKVEAHFGLTLTTRHRAKGIVPTPIGHDMVRRFEQVLEEYDTVLRAGRDLKHGVGGSLRIGYYAPVAPAFLPEILRPFLPPAGQADIVLEECHNSDAQNGLIEGRYDAILFVPDNLQTQIKYEPLIRAPAYVLMPAGHALSRHPSVSLKEVARHPLIALNRPMVTTYHQKLFDAPGHQPDIVAQANTTEMVRALVGAGLGIALLNMRPATPVSYAGDRLDMRPVTDPDTALTLAIGYAHRKPRRIVEAFVTQCLNWAQSEDARKTIVL